MQKDAYDRRYAIACVHVMLNALTILQRVTNYYVFEDISSRSSRNSEASASEFLENIEEVFSRYDNHPSLKEQMELNCLEEMFPYEVL